MSQSLQEVLNSLVKDSGDSLVLVEEGVCIAVSKPAQALLGAARGQAHALMEAIVPPAAQSKYRAAWTRARKNAVSSATIGEKDAAEKMRLHFYAFGDELHIIRIEQLRELSESPDRIANEPDVSRETPIPINNTPETSRDEAAAPAEGDHDASESHPSLPPGYSREDFFDAVLAASSSDSAFAIFTVDAVAAGDTPPFWHDVGACKAILVLINDVVRGHDTIAHLGGGRFGIVQKFINSEADCRRLQLRLMDHLSEPDFMSILGPDSHASIAWLIHSEQTCSKQHIEQLLEEGLPNHTDTRQLASNRLPAALLEV